jgi:hypothetical protein
LHLLGVACTATLNKRKWAGPAVHNTTYYTTANKSIREGGTVPREGSSMTVKTGRQAFWGGPGPVAFVHAKPATLRHHA